MLVIQKPEQVLARIALRHHAIEQVGAVVAGGEDAGGFETQLLGDIVAGRTVRGRRQRYQRHPGKALLQHPERLIVAAEIVTPARDAMRFVDREQRYPAAAQQFQEARHDQPLRRHVEKIQHPVARRPLDRARLAGWQRGMQGGGPHPRLPKRVDLVLHQRDQRRDNNAEARTQ
jgi:hypothetical protein